MAKTKQPLDANDVFPTYDTTLVNGSTLRIPDQLTNEYNVVLFYRGWW